jgi:hypothetical protein
MPNLPGTIIAMLAATSIGAIWSSCSPDFGVQGVLDRFSQIEPRILFSADGYFYNGKTIDVLPRLAQIVAALPSVEKVIVVPYTQRSPAIGTVPRAIDVHTFMAPYRARTLEFAQLPFNHPLYIMFSSGTTGVPKCIVHGAGGTLLQHLKEQAMHADLKRGDRLFYFTTCGWMMWNWLVSGPRIRRDAAALRRLAVRRQRQHTIRFCGRQRDDGVRHLGQIHRRNCQGRLAARANAQARHRSPRGVDRVAARGRRLRLCLRAHQARRDARLDVRRHGHHGDFRIRLPAVARVARRNPVRNARHAGRRVRR